MSQADSNPFDATASTLGYLYQLRLGLLISLEQEEGSDASVAIESLDDISLHAGTHANDTAHLFQAKHHVDRKGGTSNSHPDVWKSLRAWSNAVYLAKTNPSDRKFFLLGRVIDTTGD